MTHYGIDEAIFYRAAKEHYSDPVVSGAINNINYDLDDLDNEITCPAALDLATLIKIKERQCYFFSSCNCTTIKEYLIFEALVADRLYGEFGFEIE